MLANRSNLPDAILREVYLRTGDRPFGNIADVISREELAALSEGYKRVAGYDMNSCAAAEAEAGGRAARWRDLCATGEIGAGCAGADRNPPLHV